MTEQENSTGRGRAQARAMEAALMANEGLVHFAVQRQWLGRLGYQDALQEGRIALWRALLRYDAGRGRLSSYAVVAIQRAVWRAVRQAQRSEAERLEGELGRGGADLASALDRVSEGVQVRALVAGLARPLRAVIIWRYGLDGRGEATFGEIGAELGVTRQRAEQLHQQALLCLADPARSTALRRQMGRNTVADYRAYLARRRAWQRRGRMVR